ncbi:glycosyltransferase [Streptococcus pneumoniae]|nr:glycosyltransferase [Streptococcus pneumoniae]
MYTFILMLLDFFQNHDFHFFMLFFVFILIRWAVIYFHAVRYKSYSCSVSDDKLFSSVIIPVVDEPLNLFESVLNRISRHKPSEIIVVINGPKNERLVKLCHDFNEKLENNMTPIQCYYTPVPGKRNAIRVGLEHVDSQSDITVLVDSDTVWTPRTLSELLKPFVCDKKIGGVTTRQKILDPERNLVTMFANLLEEIRAEGTMKAMSVTGKVGCLPGRTIAFRTEILRECIHEFMNETFMGFHKEVSDDRSLTNLTLKKGYKTVMQDTSVVYTDAPTSWKKFIRQQLRWAEGSQYNNLKMTPWMIRNAPLMFFIYFTDMILPMLLISFGVNIFLLKILNITTIVYTASWWEIILYVLLGMIFSFGGRNFKAMSRMKWYYVFLIPVFIIVLSIIMCPIRLLGLMRCSDDLGWGTRNLTE